MVVSGLWMAWKTIGQGKPIGEVIAGLLNLLAPKSGGVAKAQEDEPETLKTENRLRAYLICREALKADLGALETLDRLFPKIVNGGATE